VLGQKEYFDLPLTEREELDVLNFIITFCPDFLLTSYLGNLQDCQLWHENRIYVNPKLLVSYVSFVQNITDK
jgi:hypothetical protein